MVSPWHYRESPPAARPGAGGGAVRGAALGLLLLLAAGCGAPAGGAPPQRSYLVWVVAEAADEVALVRYGPEGAAVERRVPIGTMPADIDGPHGIAVDPDGEHYYVSLGHGRPFGTVWKRATRDDAAVGGVTLGLFPATMDITPDGNFLFVVNFNLHGDPVPSSVSVVDPDTLLEIERITTCTRPHGSRVNPRGTRHYSACVRDDVLVEIDTRRFQVSRHYVLSRAGERPGQGPPPAPPALDRPAASCAPTWAEPSADGGAVFVACNRSDEIVEVDVEGWRVRRRLAARPGVYNLEVVGEERLLATNKRDRSISIFGLESGEELARLPTRRSVVHGVVASGDERYAFVSVEGVGTEPGTVEVVDLERLEIVARVDVGRQAAGIAFWKME